MLQTEIHPDSFTCSRKDVVAFLLRDNDETELSQRIALHSEGFDATFNGTGFEIFVFPSHDGDTVTAFMKSVSRLLERETFISFALAKMWRRLSAMPFLFYMVEERAVRTVNPFHHILNSLTPKSLPFRMKRFLDLRDMDFQLFGRKVLSVQTVIPPVHGNAVIPDRGGNVDAPVQVLILLALIELELVRLDDSAHVAASFRGIILIIPQHLVVWQIQRPFIPRSETVGFHGRIL